MYQRIEQVKHSLKTKAIFTNYRCLLRGKANQNFVMRDTNRTDSKAVMGSAAPNDARKHTQSQSKALK